MRESIFGILGGHRPRIAPDAFVAPTAVVVGRVRIGARSSLWYGTVLRGDDEEIVVGEDSNVQDLSLIHADPGFPVLVGDRVTIGHRAIVHGATVEDDVLIGMGAILLNGARIHSGAIVAAGALVTSGTEIPERSLAAGIPARIIRRVHEADANMIEAAKNDYLNKSRVHRELKLADWQDVSTSEE
ncbi:gamma carbonic anhydrase family protein [Rubrobacter taiwanensis]|uniref:Gamma carbonic anhydrase family protein n=1 Tax=Rubrobacter taiwanensis TaxID=185139 RepID=A0A4R1BRC9_9ACTN|nr:gamma carbonic anhydrase family protein [Rubrobacter taiwanensis]TCJ19867.1 gamma carbonic anhydrase family protein [Rubrobacter taiwanensis]